MSHTELFEILLHYRLWPGLSKYLRLTGVSSCHTGFQNLHIIILHMDRYQLKCGDLNASHFGTWSRRYKDTSVLTWTLRYSVPDSSVLGVGHFGTEKIFLYLSIVLIEFCIILFKFCIILSKFVYLYLYIVMCKMINVFEINCHL